MDKELLKLLQREVERQSSYALMSIEYINGYFSNSNQKPMNNTLLWYHVQSFLNSTANVSKLIWGSKDTFTSRKELRVSLNVSEDSPLRNRELRNTFEHFDERLEDWFESNESQIFIDSNIGPIGMLTNLDASKYLRNFDTSKNAITYQGKEYKLQPLVDEIVSINETAKKLTDFN